MIFSFSLVHPCDREGKGGCEHKCNKDGELVECSCTEGYELLEDNLSCKKSKFR